MQILTSKEPIKLNQTAIAIGNFDGVHIAHRELISSVVSKAKEKNLASVIFTFEENSASLLPKPTPKRILSLEDKIDRIASLNPDILYIQECSHDFFAQSSEDFIIHTLLERFGVSHVAAGYNFRFGKGKSGDAAALADFGKRLGFSTYCLPAISLDGKVVSSSAIREALKKGDIKCANAMLGYPYFIRSAVLEGKHLGRKLNFPTVNMLPDSSCAPIKEGVYITKTSVSGKEYPSITNVGTNPTIENGQIKIETHICDFSGNLYGETLLVSFLSYLRDEIKFSSLEALAAQVHKDIKKAKILFDNI